MSRRAGEGDSAPAVLDFVGARDPARALAMAQELVSTSSDSRLLEPLARLQRGLGHWGDAEGTLRKLVAAQPENTRFRLALAETLVAQGHREAALGILKAAPRHAPELDAETAELLVASGAAARARLLSSDLLREENLLPAVAQAFAAHGHKIDGLALLASAADMASEAGKPHAAFKFQRQLLDLYGPAPEGDPALRARWLRRLRLLTGGRPELVTAYFELTSDSHWQPPGERHDELLEAWDQGRGSATAGAWLVADLLDAGQSKGAGEVLAVLLARPDAPDALLTWLDGRCKRAAQDDLSLAITGALLRRAPDDTEAATRRASALHALGRDEEATALLERAALRTVFVPTLAGRLGLTALEIGNTALARDLLGKAVDEDPAARQSGVYLGYARLLVADHDFPRAKRVLRQAFRNPAATDAGAVAGYLRQSGRPVETELRDLELRPALAAEVKRLLGLGNR